MAEKTKQHYVPKVYLRLFLHSNTINVFNLKTNQLLTNIPYDDQFQKRYFYGADKDIENRLGKYESPLNDLFKKMQSRSCETNHATPHNTRLRI